MVVDMKHYFHVINEDETNILLKNLDEVFARIFLLEVHNKKLRKKIAKRGGSIINKGSSHRSMNIDISHQRDNIMITTGDLLDGSVAKNGQPIDPFENSYLLTELDTVSSRPDSPGGALNTSDSFKRRRALKSE